MAVLKPSYVMTVDEEGNARGLGDLTGSLPPAAGKRLTAITVVPEAEVERLRELLREAHEDPNANITLSLDERIREALDG